MKTPTPIPTRIPHTCLAPLVATLVIWAFTLPLSAAVQTRTLPISYGKDASGVEVIGECVVAWDDAVKAPRPGVLVFPEWWGLTDYAKARARQLAELGYVAMAVDVYGAGQTTSDPAVAGELAGRFKSDRALLQSRANVALDTLKKLREVDPKRTAAIGYCFGGTTALELARSGANVTSVVSFHGDLAPGSSPTPDTPTTAPPAKTIRAKVLVLHGALDPLVPPKVVAAFQEEMNKAGVDYVLVALANAVHGFTNPAAGSDPTRPVAYNALADKRSWQAMRAFFDETLPKP